MFRVWRSRAPCNVATFGARRHCATAPDASPARSASASASESALVALRDVTQALPQALRAGAIKLSRAVESARESVLVATENDSETQDRDDALARTRYALHLYKRLCETVEPLPDSMPNGLPAAPAGPSASREKHAESTTQPTLTVRAHFHGSYYSVPSLADADAPQIVDSTNPVVRGFGPHLAHLRHHLYVSHRQRVWIGWTGWF